MNYAILNIWEEGNYKKLICKKLNKIITSTLWTTDTHCVWSKFALGKSTIHESYITLWQQWCIFQCASSATYWSPLQQFILYYFCHRLQELYCSERISDFKYHAFLTVLSNLLLQQLPWIALIPYVWQVQGHALVLSCCHAFFRQFEMEFLSDTVFSLRI